MKLFSNILASWCRSKSPLILISGILLSGNLLAQNSHSDYAVSTINFPLQDIKPGLDLYEAEGKFSFLTLEMKIAKGKPFTTTLCYTKNQQPVEAWYFPGISERRALIIGGVHGSELSSIELAKHLIGQLSNGEKPFFSVIILPSLFPDNAFSAMEKIRDPFSNSGRYTTDTSADPNRQMPPLGHAFDPASPFDLMGREIEKENQYLLRLIQEYKPERIASLHAIRDPQKAGIFADPKTDHEGFSLGFQADSLLAHSMNQVICRNGGKLCSSSEQNIAVVYHFDPPAVAHGHYQQRNLCGSRIPGRRGEGASLGSWATTAVCSDDPALKRDAISMITVEFPGYRSSIYQQEVEKFNYFLNLRLYSLALSSVFLQP